MERGIKSRALQIRKHMVAVAGWHQSCKHGNQARHKTARHQSGIEMERGIKSRALQIRKHMVAVAGWHQSLKYKSSTVSNRTASDQLPGSTPTPGMHQA